jgi:hypothetical protein
LGPRRRISSSAEARADLRSAYDYYEVQRAGLGREFVDRLIEQLDAISQRPGSLAIVYRSALVTPPARMTT